jgi:hypothetical protein
MDYMLEIHIPTLEAYDSVQGYSPPIKGTRLLLPEESVEVLRKLMTPAGVQQTIAEVRRQIAARNERGADAQRNAAEQRRIEEAFD